MLYRKFYRCSECGHEWEDGHVARCRFHNGVRQPFSVGSLTPCNVLPRTSIPASNNRSASFCALSSGGSGTPHSYGDVAGSAYTIMPAASDTGGKAGNRY